MIVVLCMFECCSRLKFELFSVFVYLQIFKSFLTYLQILFILKNTAVVYIRTFYVETLEPVRTVQTTYRDRFKRCNKRFFDVFFYTYSYTFKPTVLEYLLNHEIFTTILLTFSFQHSDHQSHSEDLRKPQAITNKAYD